MNKLRVQVTEKVFIYPLVLCSFAGVVALFIYLNRVHPFHFIDEGFHIRQVHQYCNGNFREWDPKITTLPGLYVITALILQPLKLCETLYIRTINLFGTFLNFFLVYAIVNEVSQASRAQKWSNWMQLAVTYNIAFFPPLFFWHFLYYTDVVSLTMVLLMLLLHIQKKFKLVVPIGILAILIRQTNIIWLAFLTVERALNLLQPKIDRVVTREALTTPYHFQLLWKIVKEETSKGTSNFVKFCLHICKDLLPYIIVCILFLGFVIWNQGIVVGDRSAHVATIHIPQLFYFSLFAFAFAWPYMIVHLKRYFNFLVEHWIIASVLFAFLTVAVHTNTLVHPYVLADNRHYVFYFWKNFMGRYYWFKYLLIPVYSFILFAMYCGFRHLRFMTQVNYTIMVSAVLVPQLLVEPRYFIIPYLFYRLSLNKPTRWQIVAESLTTIVINTLQFIIFANKVFHWRDQIGPQRIAW